MTASDIYVNLKALLSNFPHTHTFFSSHQSTKTYTGDIFMRYRKKRHIEITLFCCYQCVYEDSKYVKIHLKIYIS